MQKTKSGIKQKVIFTISISILIVMITGIVLTYFLGAALFRNTIGKQYEQMASGLAVSIAADLAGEIEDVETYASRPLWRDVVEEINSRYKFTDKESLALYFNDMDKKWAASDNESALVKEYVDNRIALSMRDILKIRGNIAELFITDKFGGLVAASDRTSDFYQADEDWWQKAYNDGKGEVYIGNAEFDASSKKWVVSIAVPIKDRNGVIIGICKNAISIDRLFGRLADFKIGQTGHAVVIDKNGIIVFHSGIEPMKVRDYEIVDVKKLLSGKDHYSIINNAESHPKKMFVSFARVKPSHALPADTDWLVLINQDAFETFRSLHVFIVQLVVITIILLILIIPIGSFFGELFAKPIHKLRMATEKIINGGWDYVLNIKTGDEIEEFADTFNEMLQNLKNKQEELLSAKNELEKISQDLETKVEERTRDLNLTQEATLNILEDLTEAKAKLEKEAKALEEALRIKSDFTSTVSHELRTPLAAIKESISIVSDGTTGPIGQEQKEFLDMAKRNVDRLNRLINDILDFQKLEAGKIIFNMREDDINEAVSEAARTMAPLAQGKGLDLVIDLADNMPHVRFDRDRIMQVLTNLISNAIKFTEKGNITITTKIFSNVIEVSVEDTGTGVKEEDMPKLFQHFEQLEKGVNRKTGGTGLGLAISKGIIEQHRGKIWAESELGKGAILKFVLPIKERRSRYDKKDIDR
jgi:signal transduction histidine kinase